MKILELRFKNLNSLYGEWSVDFTSPEYLSDGIFAIIGPTGSGKSTILDALSLALYARTPRLKSITKNVNEIMSRQTADCYAEVTFETQSGKFRCNWSQRKAHNKKDGNLIDSKHEISDAISGKTIETKKSKVVSVIVEKTGMDFDRFTRSILLAQGGFAAFLQANPDERSPILEQITGTEIYSEISKKVYERFRKENDDLELLKAETVGIMILNEQQESELNRELINRKNIEKDLIGKKENIKNSILWLSSIESLQNEIIQIDNEYDKIKEEIQLFEPEKERLNKAIKVSELESEFAALISKREEQKFDIDSLRKNCELLPQFQNRIIEKESTLKISETALEDAKKRQKNELDIIRAVRDLDAIISEKELILQKSSFDHKKMEKELSEKTIEYKNILDNQRSGFEKLAKIENYIALNSNDEILVSQFERISEQMKNLKSVVNDISLKQKKMDQHQKQVKIDLDNYKKHKQLFESINNKNESCKKELEKTQELLKVVLGDRLLREYRVERDNLMREMVYLKKIVYLEEERKKLEDKKPCPLCGSLDHPFAQGNIPKIDDTEERINSLFELINKAEQLENRLKYLENKEIESIRILNGVEKNLILARQKQKDSNLNLEQLKGDLKVLSDRYSNLRNQILLKLNMFGVSSLLDFGLSNSFELLEDHIDNIVSKLSNRLKKWQEFQTKKIIIDKMQNEFASQLKIVQAVINSISDSLKEKLESFRKDKDDFENLKDKRKDIYGVKNPIDEERMLEKLVADALKFEKDATKERDKIKDDLNEIKTRIATLKEIVDKRVIELQNLESNFIESLIKSGLEDEDRFLANRLSSIQKEKLQIKAKELNDKIINILTRKKDRESRISKEIEKRITKLTLEELKKNEAEIGELLKQNGEEIGVVKHRISDNIDAKAKYRNKYLLIEAQKEVCSRWGKLHYLIGSSDGKKYRNFAQGITFEIMVSHANRELIKMSDRYLLVRDEEQPLELNVIDNYQAGEIRSTKNLSGGESFIVSLSLALGLSNMASKNVRVDSLFLDEGFGTLDEYALDTALDTLAELKQYGKLIGVISHVSALKDRIGIKIEVFPERGGRSIIKGPGCIRKFNS